MIFNEIAVYGDLQSFLSLTSTELPNATATALLLDSYNFMIKLYEDENYWYDNTDTVNQNLQKQAELHIAANIFFNRLVTTKRLDNDTSYGTFPGALNLGGIKIDSNESNQQKAIDNYTTLSSFHYKKFSETMNALFKKNSSILPPARSLFI